MKKNNSLLVLGIVSISLLLILSAIQSSTAQRYDNDDHDRDKWNRHDDDDDNDDHDRDKWNRHDDDDDNDDHDRDKWNRHDDDDDDNDDHDRDKWNRHDDDDDDNDDHDRDDFELTVRLISDKDRHMPDFKVRANGETKYIDGDEFEDNDKAKVKFYLNNVDDKERVCITNERTDDKICKRFNTERDEGTVKFYIY
jgi:hypothetical protein